MTIDWNYGLGIHTTRWMTSSLLVSCPILGVIFRRIVFHSPLVSGFALTFLNGPAFTRWDSCQITNVEGIEDIVVPAIDSEPFPNR